MNDLDMAIATGDIAAYNAIVDSMFEVNQNLLSVSAASILDEH